MNYEDITKIGKSLPQIPIERILHDADSGIAVEMHIPAGAMLGKHKHNYSHISILGLGDAILHKEDSEPRPISAPYVITVEAGKWHNIEAVTNIIWYCTHDSLEDDETTNE